MPAGVVADWAVSGYGIDQIYLRFRQALDGEYGSAPDEIVLGVLQDDVDRVVERFRAGPKPYFELVGDRLELRGIPIEAPPEAWLKDNPVRIRSYLKAWLQTGYYNRNAWQRRGQTVYESECLRGTKEAIASRLLERLVHESREAGIEPLFVLFYGERALRVETWREAFLRDTLSRLGARIIDTKPLFLEAAEDVGIGLSDFFFPLPNGHPNIRGNDLVAREIYRRYRSEYSWPLEIHRAWKLTVELGKQAQNSVEVDLEGWATDGDFFSWTREPVARVRINTNIPADRDLILQLDAHCALRRPDDERSLVVRFNGTQIGEYAMATFPDCWTSRLLEAAIPSELVTADQVSVEIDLPSLLAPGEAGFDLNDTRKLGIAFTSMTLRER